ncbi:hypothetical protein BRC83_00640 [Halobacteriales archaeon QS_1_68_17]|nr:MAG: hypothetical protein BRC83_00640 [Halobacteriales archaeon QS_1_68_17]
MRLAGAAAALGFGSGVAGAQQDGGDGADTPEWPVDCPSIPCIDATYGLPIAGGGALAPQVRARFQPDHTVELRVGEPTIRPSDAEPPFDFFFEPAGLAVQPGDVVAFEAVSPEHTVTAYHPDQGRQQRVPDGVPAFSSPVTAQGSTWLYAFGQSGVYDLVCTPHEPFGMVMRVVAGDETEPTVSGDGRPPLPPAAAVLDAPELDPAAIVERGTVSWTDLTVEFPGGGSEGGE